MTYYDQAGNELAEGMTVHTVGDMPAADHDEGRIVEIDPEAYSGLTIAWDGAMVQESRSSGDGLAAGQRPAEWAERLREELMVDRLREDLMAD